MEESSAKMQYPLKTSLPAALSSRNYELYEHTEDELYALVCGHKGTEYVEKFSPELKDRVEKTTRRIWTIYTVSLRTAHIDRKRSEKGNSEVETVAFGEFRKE